MAVVKLGPIVSDIRGSIKDTTFARNQGGIYARTRSGPAGPPSAEQIKSTDAMTTLSQYWSSTLTAAQRAAWSKYAHQHPRSDRWGKQNYTNGYSRFIATNFRFARPAGFVNWDDPPDLPPLWPGSFQFTAASGTGNLTVTVPPNEYDPPPQAIAVQAFWSPIVNAGINFLAAPWTYAGINYGDPVFGWTFDPWALAYPGGLSIGDRLFVKFIVQGLTGGEFSSYYQDSVIIT